MFERDLKRCNEFLEYQKRIMGNGRLLSVQNGNFIGQMILGDSIGISALWVLFAIVVGGDLFGLVGMVVGVPIFATIYGILRTAARHGLRQKGFTDVEESVSASAAGDEIPDDPRESEHRMSLLRQWKEKIMSIGKKKNK